MATGVGRWYGYALDCAGRVGWGVCGLGLGCGLEHGGGLGALDCE